MSVASEINRIKSNIADAYTEAEAKGATMPVTENSANLADTIGSISRGGGSYVEKKDVNFYDYDGTVLHSYTFAQASALTELPELPEHDGLTAQEWNRTLEQVQSCAQSGYPVEAGATYTTSDGSTRLYFFVAKGTKLPVFKIYLTIMAGSSVTVDTGDGNIAVLEDTSTYFEYPGSEEVDKDTIFCIRFIGGSFTLGYGGSYTMYGISYGSDTLEDIPILVEAEIGTNCTKINSYAFYKSYSLCSVVIANSVIRIENNAFESCFKLNAVVIPKNCLMEYQAFKNCYNLLTAILPQNHFDIPRQAFYYCNNLVNIIIPPTRTYIYADAFSYNMQLVSAVIPHNVTRIESGVFAYCPRLYTVDLTDYTDPQRIPSLTSTSAFNNTPSRMKIKVSSQTMLDAFAAATNWSDYASRFVVA